MLLLALSIKTRLSWELDNCVVLSTMFDVMRNENLSSGRLVKREQDGRSRSDREIGRKKSIVCVSSFHCCCCCHHHHHSISNTKSSSFRSNRPTSNQARSSSPLSIITSQYQHCPHSPQISPHPHPQALLRQPTPSDC